MSPKIADPEPQPTDGPEYHADHASWAERNVKKDERVPLPEEIVRRDGEDGESLLRRRRETRGGMTTGFCLDAIRLEPFVGKVALARDPDEWHLLCRGAITNGAGKTSLCLCPCHDTFPRCHECKKPYDPEDIEYDRSLRKCVSRTACADRIAEAHRMYVAANPTPWRDDVAARREAGDDGDGPAARINPPKREKAPRKAKGGTPQRCHCGCGGMTKGGRFCMGHDMRLKGQLFKASRGSTNASDPGQQAAVDEIVARGWSEVDIHHGLLATARGKDPLEVIRAAVYARYDGVEGDLA